MATTVAGSAFEKSGAAVTGEGFFGGVRVGERGVICVDEVVDVAGEGGLVHEAYFLVEFAEGRAAGAGGRVGGAVGRFGGYAWRGCGDFWDL